MWDWLPRVIASGHIPMQLGVAGRSNFGLKKTFDWAVLFFSWRLCPCITEAAVWSLVRNRSVVRNKVYFIRRGWWYPIQT
jgi:hypothetical protein